MKEVFADAGYWIAMINPSDELHQTARHVTTNCGYFRIVTTEMVLVEVLNHFANFGPDMRQAVVDVVKEAKNNPNVEVVPQTSKQFNDATEYYVERLDKGWSVVDCASFVEMEKRNIADALAYDTDFAQAGFRSLLRSD